MLVIPAVELAQFPKRNMQVPLDVGWLSNFSSVDRYDASLKMQRFSSFLISL